MSAVLLDGLEHNGCGEILKIRGQDYIEKKAIWGKELNVNELKIRRAKNQRTKGSNQKTEVTVNGEKKVKLPLSQAE